MALPSGYVPGPRGDMGGPRRMALRDFQRKLAPVNYFTFDGFAGVYFVESLGDDFSDRRLEMFTNTLITLVFIIAISSSVVAADKRHDGVGANYRGPGPVLINRCLPADWDPYGMRCDRIEHPSA